MTKIQNLSSQKRALWLWCSRQTCSCRSVHIFSLLNGSRVEILPKHQISFFIIVPSSSVYAERLGGGETFSGLVIGIPTFVSALTLVPLLKYDKGMECLDRILLRREI